MHDRTTFFRGGDVRKTTAHYFIEGMGMCACAGVGRNPLGVDLGQEKSSC